jgi:hypothetical protein
VLAQSTRSVNKLMASGWAAELGSALFHESRTDDYVNKAILAGIATVLDRKQQRWPSKPAFRLIDATFGSVAAVRSDVALTASIVSGSACHDPARLIHDAYVQDHLARIGHARQQAARKNFPVIMVIPGASSTPDLASIKALEQLGSSLKGSCMTTRPKFGRNVATTSDRRTPKSTKTPCLYNRKMLLEAWVRIPVRPIFCCQYGFSLLLQL